MTEMQIALADFQSDSVTELAADYPNLEVTLDRKVVTIKGRIEDAWDFLSHFPAITSV